MISAFNRGEWTTSAEIARRLGCRASDLGYHLGALVARRRLDRRPATAAEHVEPGGRIQWAYRMPHLPR